MTNMDNILREVETLNQQTAHFLEYTESEEEPRGVYSRERSLRYDTEIYSQYHDR